MKSIYLNKILRCPNCRQEFVATEIIPEMVDGRPVYSFSAYFQSTRESSSDASSSSSSKTSESDSENQAQDRDSREEIVHVIAARGNANEA